MKLDVDIPKESTYNMVLRYINPYPDRVIGTIKMETEACSPENPECNQEENVHSVLLNPTGGQPAFVTVSGDKGIYPSPFQLKTETYRDLVCSKVSSFKKENIHSGFWI